MALGAFLAGMVVGRSEFSGRAATEALPMRDAFAVLFFVSVGMLFDPEQLLRSPLFVALTLAVVVVIKPLAAFAIMRLSRQPARASLAVSVALAQIGEFSFIVAALGTNLGVLPEDATHTLVAAAIVSITVNPMLFRFVAVPTGEERSLPLQHKAIVVGYGPIGRTASRLLRENQIAPTVIDLNAETMRVLQSEGVEAVHGDASQPETLKRAGISAARSVIFSSAGESSIAEAIRVVRELNPSALVLARTNYLRDVAALRAAGADLVFAGEAEVALSFTEAILTNLGATAEQIERERARVHAEIT
jgi:CPA2 family monovalent cation:H+ antiporter-2